MTRYLEKKLTGKFQGTPGACPKALRLFASYQRVYENFCSETSDLFNSRPASDLAVLATLLLLLLLALRTAHHVVSRDLVSFTRGPSPLQQIRKGTNSSPSSHHHHRRVPSNCFCASVRYSSPGVLRRRENVDVRRVGRTL